MPLRLIGLLAFVGLLVSFIGFNLGNVADVSFGFHVFRGVPVFLTAFVSFALGLLVALPSVFIARFSARKRFRPSSAKALQRKTADPGLDEGSYGVD